MSGSMSLVSPLLLGLLGSMHCVAMCGGIAGAFAMAAPSAAGRAGRVRLLCVLGTGRILGYAGAGVLAGGLGFGLASVLGPYGPAALRVMAGLLLLAAALLVAGIGVVPATLERFGAALWQRIVPLARSANALPMSSCRALALGFLWGWIPCGLVYAALGWAATAGSPLQGAFAMVAFGLGTLPATVATGAAAAKLGRLVHAPTSRRAAAALLGLFALWTVAGGLGTVARGTAAPACHRATGGLLH